MHASDKQGSLAELASPLSAGGAVYTDNNAHLGGNGINYGLQRLEKEIYDSNVFLSWRGAHELG